VGGAVAIGAVLGLQAVKGGTILWIVAFIIGLSLLIEHPRIRAAERAGGR